MTATAVKDLKIVLNVQEGRTLVGVRGKVNGTDTDPYPESVNGGLAEALKEVPAIVAAAEAKWAVSPTNPKYKKPKAKPEPKSKPKPKARKEDTGAVQPEAEATPGKVPEVTDAEPTPDEAAADLPLLSGEESPPEIQCSHCDYQALNQVDLDGHVGHSHPEETEDPLQGATQEEDSVPTFNTVPQAEAEAKVAAAAAAPRNTGGWSYFVKEPRSGPYDTVHEALRAMGVSQADIDGHKWWHRLDRLPKKHAEAIERQAK